MFKKQPSSKPFTIVTTCQPTLLNYYQKNNLMLKFFNEEFSLNL